jgi:CHASE2 domain-containing sensor protein
MRLGPLRDASTRVLWLVPVAATLLAGVLSNVAPLAPLEDLSRDWRFRVRGVRQPTVPITIVAIDEASLSSPQLKEPLLFWGKHHARAFRILKAGGARAVGLDLIQPLSLVDLDLLESNPDLEQAQALATMPNVVLAFARSLDAQGNISDTLPNEQLMGALAVGGGREGFVNFSEEADGVVRRYTLVDTDKSLSFSLALAATAAGQEPVAAARSLKLGRHQIPLDEEQACLINYRGPDRTFARISYADLLARPAKYRAQIKNSICLIGLTSFVLQDYHLSPSAPRTRARTRSLRI